jgi:hypothetical protein
MNVHTYMRLVRAITWPNIARGSSHSLFARRSHDRTLSLLFPSGTSPGKPAAMKRSFSRLCVNASARIGLTVPIKAESASLRCLTYELLA